MGTHYLLSGHPQSREDLAWQIYLRNAFQMRHTMVWIILCYHCLPKLCGNRLAHRALEDVKAMKRIFCSEALSPLLNQLTIRNREQIVANWQLKHQELSTIQKYAVQFGRSCTKAMAKRLSQLKLPYEMLQSTFEDNFDDRQAFYGYLRKAGITRKVWREKIWTHFQGRRPA